MFRGVSAALTAAIVSLSSIAAQADPIRILTTPSSSPFSRGADHTKPGFNHEYAEAMAAHAGLEIVIEYYPWKRAQKMAQEADADVMIFGLTRTEAREPLYDWVSRMITVEWAFMSTGEPVNDLDTARGLDSIGARSVYKRYLDGEGLTNVQESDTLNNFKKLQAGRVGAVLTNTARGHFMWVEELGESEDSLVIGAGLRTGDIWLGASKGFDPEVARKMEAANVALRADGTYAALYQKYFGSLPMLDPGKPDQVPTHGAQNS